MSTTQHTGHYNLPTFGDNPNDRPSWRGDFTDAMTKIDNQMYANATNITTATAAANNATTAANNATTAASKATETATGARSTADGAVGRLDALGATSNTEAGRLKSKIDTTATELNAVKSDLSGFKTNTNGDIAALQSTTTGIKNNLNDITSSVHTNTTGITGIKANLNALHADSTANATALYTAIQNSSRILSVNQPFVSRGSNIIVTFGDSYAKTADTRSWAHMLAQKLGWTLHNYAVSGAGYLSPNTTYMSEFNTAKADTSYKHNDVSLVVIGGSRNSNDGYSGKIKTAAQQLFQAVSNEYPNARIIAIPMLWDKTPVSGYWRYNAASVDEAAILAGVESIPWAWTWNLGRENAFDNKDIHPNELGTGIIVNYIMRYMLGTYNGRHEVFVWRPKSNPAEFVLTVDASAGTITYGLMVESGVTSANYTNVSGLPMWAWNAEDTTNQGRAWVAAITNGANNTTLFHIDTDGHFGWQGFTTNPSATPNGLAGAQFTRAW